MTEKIPRIMKYMFIALAVLFALLILFVNGQLATLAEWIYPGAGLWAHVALLSIEGIAFLWFWRGMFGGSDHLLILGEDTAENRAQFRQELMLRMRKNSIVRDSGLEKASEESDDDFLDRCLALLKEKADYEIQLNAKRTFLATALTQNGRLDALIVFVSLCRLVWRVSAIYNQRPHPREVFSLYSAVATTTFLALSIEELDISTEITHGFGETLNAALPAGFTESVPFAGKALRTFTNATIDGAANCFLALRAGIITRNAYAYAAIGQQRPNRAAVFKEAGGVLFAMSNELVGKIAGAVADGLAGAVKFAGGKTVEAGKGLVEGVASGTVSVVQGTGRGIAAAGNVTLQAVQDTGKGIAKAGEKVVDTSVDIVHEVGSAVGKVAGDTVKIVEGTGKGLVKAGGMVLDTGVKAGGMVLDTGVKAGGKVLDTGVEVVEGVGNAVGKVASGTVKVVEDTGKGIYKAGDATVRFALDAGQKAAGTVHDAGMELASTGKKTVKGVGRLVGKTVSKTAGLLLSPFKNNE